MMSKFAASVALATSVVAGAALVSFAPAASAATITVLSTADIFLAGQSSVPTNFPSNGGTGGLGAGTLPPSISVFGGETLNLSATGTVSCCLGGSPTNGPNGGGLAGSAAISGYGNVGSFNNAIQFSLVGVFGDPSLAPPWSIFVIGSADTVTVPAGATSLYLGLADALGFQNPPGYYNDNTGQFTVTYSATTPLPSTWLMLLSGFVGLGFFAYRGTKKNSAALAAA
jgi:hypothetical protein